MELGSGSSVCGLHLPPTGECETKEFDMLRWSLSKALGFNSVSQSVKLNTPDTKTVRNHNIM